MADKQYTQALAAVTHYEKLVRQAKVDVTAFGRTSDADAKPYEGDDAARVHAQRTWERAWTVAQHVPAGDPAVKEALNDLVAAVSPIIDT